MRDKRHKILRRRQWLRPVSSWGPQSSLHTSVTLEDSNDWCPGPGKKKRHRSIYGNLGFRDCSDYISFDFNASNEGQWKKNLAVLDKLANEIELMRMAWLEAKRQVDQLGGWKGEE